MSERVKVLVVRQSEVAQSIADWLEANQSDVREVLGTESVVIKNHDAADPTVSVTIRYHGA